MWSPGTQAYDSYSEKPTVWSTECSKKSRATARSQMTADTGSEKKYSLANVRKTAPWPRPSQPDGICDLTITESEIPNHKARSRE